MGHWNFKDLVGFQGKRVRIASTEGEIIIAKVLSVGEEYEDLVVDVLSTNQPERYERLGRKHTEAGWVIPFQFIADIALDAAGGADIDF